MKMVTWTAERLGSMPDLPNPNVNDTNLVLMDTIIDPAAPELLQDGESHIFRVSGQYTYGMKKAQGSGDQLAMGTVPFTDIPYQENLILPANFVHGIIDQGGAQQSQLGQL
jgi:hypothetical protein